MIIDLKSPASETSFYVSPELDLLHNSILMQSFNTCKAVAGLDLRQILEKAQINLGSKLETGSILADFNDPAGDRIQVILE